MSPELENLYFFSSYPDSKDIKGKQLIVNFNTLNSTLLQSNITIYIWILYMCILNRYTFKMIMVIPEGHLPTTWLQVRR